MYALTHILLTVLLATSYSYARATDTVGTVSIPLGKFYKYGSQSLEGLKKSLSAMNPKLGLMTPKNAQDLYYYGPITIGTPGQSVNVQFDISSADVYVPSKQICSKDKEYCRSHNTYDHSKSNTYYNNGTKVKIEYGSGKVSGIVSRDILEISGVTVKDQLFTEALSLDPHTSAAGFDGIVGLAYPAVSDFEAATPLINLAKQGVIRNPVFSFYVNKEVPVSKSSAGSAELILGGVNPEHYVGDITYAEVYDQFYWNIHLDGLFVNSKQIVGSVIAVPDYSTSLIIGSSDYTDPINQAIGGKYDEGLYTVDCSTIDRLPEVTFVISSVKFVLQPQEYIIKINDGGDEVLCISSFAGAPYNMSYVILGDAFVRKYYTVFDMANNRTGFALAN